VVVCDASKAALLEPMEPYFASMTNAHAAGWGPTASPPATSSGFRVGEVEVLVDLAGLVDIGAEMARVEKELASKTAAIASKQKQLGNQNFVSRAPAEVIEKERTALRSLQQQQQSLIGELAALKERR
jgi:valyl-tRNA synthetase